MKFRVRVDDKHPKLLDYLVAYCSSKDHTLVRHVLPTGNPHFHFYIDLPMVMSVSAYKYQWKTKVVPLFQLQSTDWSIKECNPERIHEYKQYLFNQKHGNASTLISSTTDVEGFKQLAQQVAQEYASTKKKKSQITAWDIAMELRSEINKMENVDTYQRIDKIVDLAIQIHNSHKKTFCDFSLSRVIQTAIADTQYKGYLIQKVVNKCFSTEL